jgi:hypothetical protein
VDLDAQVDLQSLFLQRDQAIEPRFPALVSSEIFVGQEEARDPGGRDVAHEAFEIVGRAEPALAAPDIDEGADRAAAADGSPRYAGVGRTANLCLFPEPSRE